MPTPGGRADDTVSDHLDGLCTYLCQRLPNEQDVLDLTQEACLRLLHTSTNQRIDNPPAPYLLQIANRQLWHHYRDRKQLIDVNIDLEQLPAIQPSPVDAAIFETRQLLVEDAMRELPEKCQTALVLRWRDDLPIAEIVEHMNLSRAMVKKYLANAVSHFRKRLQRFVVADATARSP